MRLGALAVALLFVVAAPPGATARCTDGTYSFSQHRSGTCSHHGGVAQWLGRAASAPASGHVVLLAPRTRARDCRLGALPDRACSPGATMSGLTQAVLCAPGFSTASIRNVPESEKHRVEVEYGLAPGAYGSRLEIDHIVPLELGGSNDIANLFPERAPGFHTKDRLENALHGFVCSGRMRLGVAQRGIASSWPALFRRVFGSTPTV
ncbi:MAG TPA: DUF3761 domain-containing protein [Gaiellaceae bacterium]|nr:DUF3761 domain-containing protein [Gaiellaceae bacterium]